MAAALLAAAAMAVGYVLGRIRPARRASYWAHWLIYGRNFTRARWQWWVAQLVFACEIVVLLSTRPRQTVHAWRHRNDPPLPLSPPVRVRDLREPEPPQ
ncbi:hypothetical protein [Streptomyces sp. NPDC101145]|uniref:hypothetical protein n=1 Tax=Streptomyces sp. NPDC101145 TaxID=3366112 RepID=UPI0038013498